MSTKAPMLKTLSSFAARDGMILPELTSQNYHPSILTHLKRNPLSLDRPLRLHPTPINLLHRPLRPLHNPNPTPQIKIITNLPSPPTTATIINPHHHRRRRPSRRSCRHNRQPSRNHPRPHVRRRRQTPQPTQKLPRRPPRPPPHRPRRRPEQHFYPRSRRHHHPKRLDERRPNRPLHSHQASLAEKHCLAG